LGQTEIGEQSLLAVDQDIRRFDVAVNNANFVKGVCPTSGVGDDPNAPGPTHNASR
jgi:hypothetical protein